MDKVEINGKIEFLKLTDDISILHYAKMQIVYLNDELKVIINQIDNKNDTGFSTIKETMECIERASKLKNIKLTEVGKIDVEGFTEHFSLNVDIEYASVKIENNHYYALRFIDYKSDKFIRTLYEDLYKPLYIPIKDANGDVIAEEYIDDIFMDSIPWVDVEIPLNITPNELIILTPLEFKKRLFIEGFSQFNLETPKVELPSNLETPEEFLNAFNEIEYSKKNIFITGKAGTSKSTILKYIIANSIKRLVVLAPTGLAALNVFGQTVHSFFKLPLHILDVDNFDILSNPKFKSIELIIIDEVSMLRADILDAVDLVLRKNRNNDIPFGGVQVIFIGDPFQLSPVVDKSSSASKYFRRKYKSEWFFDALCWSESKPHIIELDKVYRQKDFDFIELLDRIRKDETTSRDLEHLNERTNKKFGFKEKVITLTTTNKRSDEINLFKLEQLDNKSFMYEGSFEGVFPRNKLPVEFELVLKINAQVIFSRNDPDKRWVNGTIGIIEELDENKIKVLINDNVFSVDRVVWKNIEYEYDENEKTLNPIVVGTYCQFPLKLAWAITIHKSQGQSYDKVTIDLGTGAFAAGQLYVALSRCRSLSGLSLTKKILQSDIIVDKRVSEFYSNI